MTLKRLRLRNLLFHWRGNLAVFLGVVVGTAVLTGALLVGDSLRGSLRDRTLQQMGWVDEALIASRFFRQELADELVQSGAAERVAPVLMLQATVVVRQKEGGPIRRQVRGVTVLGVEERFWPPQAEIPNGRREPVPQQHAGAGSRRVHGRRGITATSKAERDSARNRAGQARRQRHRRGMDAAGRTRC